MPANNTDRATPVARSGDKLLPSLGILLVTGGLVLLGWFVYLWFAPVPAPYHYELVKEGSPGEFPELELDAWPELQLKQYDVRVEDIIKPVAQVILAQKGNTSVLIDWKNNTRDILHTLSRKPTELSAVATAIKAHAEQDALILGWWDTSRQMSLLTGHETLFNSHMNEPLIIPLDWVELSGTIQDYEKQFWQGSASSQQEREQFKQFGAALTAAPEEGIAQLRALIGSERAAYLIIHIVDLYRLGLMYPEKLGVAYQNLPLTGNMHGMINQMKVQLAKNDFDTYTLQSITDSEIRAFFLSDEQSSETLLVHQPHYIDGQRYFNLIRASFVVKRQFISLFFMPLCCTHASTLYAHIYSSRQYIS